MDLSEIQKWRYDRQLMLPEVGYAGQQKLLAARVLVVGVGGLGSPAAFYLAAAGVGTIGLLDDDVVELSNLQRQVLHATADLGRQKIESGAEKLHALNPELQLRKHAVPLTKVNAAIICADYDFIVDAMDNFKSKLQLADACHILGKPYSHAGILGFFGQTMTVMPGQSACSRCLLCEDDCADQAVAGVIGSAPGVIGAIQAVEAVKYIIGAGGLLTNTLLACDLLNMQFRRVAVRRRPSCPLCGVEKSQNNGDQPQQVVKS
ncbi:MAG: ThiF family adenylyltransferase [Kiritimatiellia bacterium]|nr:HesA/MoeB/ThiF family protein [Lentisphaerota bacterium]